MDRDIELAVRLVGEDRGATAAVERVARGVEGLGKAATAPLRAMSGLAGGLADIAKNAVGFAAGGVLLNAPGALLDMAKGAAEDERATARLAVAIGNLGGNVGQHTKDVNAAIASGQKLAFSDDDVRDSYVALAAATGNSDEALKRQKSAMDLARGAGIPLSAASKLLGKINEDNVQVFKRMGITLADNATEADALAEVQKRFGGQADAYAKSTAGQFEQAQIAFAETQESIGAMLLPALTAVGNVLVEVLPRVQDFVTGLAGGISERIGPALQTASALFGALFDTFGRIAEGVAGVDELRDVIGEFANDIPILQPFIPLINTVIDLLGDLGAFIQTKLLPIFDDFGEVVQKVLAGDIGGAIKQFLGMIGDTQLALVDQMLGWGKALIEWIIPMIPGLLDALQTFTQEMLSFVAAHVSELVEHLAEWAASFIDWIGPQIPGLLRELGGFVASMFDWLIAQLPGIIQKLAEWGLAFVQWVAPRIPPLLLELGKLLLEIGGWIQSHAIPEIQKALAIMGVKFYEWVATEVLPKLPGELAKIGTAIDGWVAGAATAARTKAMSIGTDIVNGIVDGFNNLKGWLGQQAANLATGAINAAKAALIPGSPSRLAADEVGRPLVWGIGQGMIEEMPWLQEQSRTVAKAAIDAYIDEIDRGTELSRNAWSRVMAPGGGAGGGGGGGAGMAGINAAFAALGGLGNVADLYSSAHFREAGSAAGLLDGYMYDPEGDTNREYKDMSGTGRITSRGSALNMALYRARQWLALGKGDEAAAIEEGIAFVLRHAVNPDATGFTPMARGGPVWPGRSYLVGERGPELLSMGARAGQITPMGAVYHITVNVAGSVATEGRIVDSIHAGLLRKQRLNGAGSLGLA